MYIHICINFLLKHIEVVANKIFSKILFIAGKYFLQEFKNCLAHDSILLAKNMDMLENDKPNKKNCI